MPTELRPESLDELTGQEALKQKARIAIGAALLRGEPLPHVLLTSAGGGLGKTTLAQVIANELFAPLVCTSGQCVSSALDLRNLLVRLQPNSLLLVDEFHCLGRLAAEELLVALEEGVLNVNVGTRGPIRMALPPFTLIAATTKASAIEGPLRQRFGLHFHFDFYTVSELKHIVSRMANHVGIEFDDDVCKGIAQRALGVPRKALRLVERVRDVVQAKRLSAATEAELDLAMSLEGVDHLGLRDEERRILRVLAEAEPRAVSARNLSLALGTEVATVTDVLEPVMVRLGLVTIGSGGRRITGRGIAHLKSLEGLQ